MAVQRLPGDPEFLAEGADFGLLLTHGGHGQADLGRRHLERAPAGPAARTCRGKTGDSAFSNKCSLELRQGSEDPEDELAGCGRRVDRGTLAREHLEADAAVGEVVHGVDQVAQVTTEPVELPHQKGVPLTECLQAGRQMRTVILLSGRVIFVKIGGRYACGQECVSSEISGLRPVGF